MGDVLEGVEAVLAQVVIAQVGHHGHVGQVVAQPAPHDAAPGGLENRRLDLGVREQRGRADRAGVVARHEAGVVEEHARGGGEAHGQPRAAERAGDQPGRGGLAVGAGDGYNGHGERPVLREQVAHDVAGDVHGRPLRGR